jgi:hypothetical protein
MTVDREVENLITRPGEEAETLIVKKHDLLNQKDSNPERAEKYDAEVRRIDARLDALRPKQ